MPQMDLRIEATVNGAEDEDGMRLLELEDALSAIRMAGGKDSTRLKVDTSRRSRIRVVTGQLRGDDEATADLDVADEWPGTAAPSGT
jgi:hypothetical protein